MSKSLVEMAADIVKAQCTSTSMSAEDITSSLQNTFNVLQVLQANEVSAEAVPVGEEKKDENTVEVAPEKSILRNKIICLECGQSFKLLSPKHLASHGLNGKDYRRKYGFPLRQPLCAKALSERRKKAGKERGVPENLLKAIAARKLKGSTKGKAAKKSK
ncbi:MAG: MucR family transcriptional regulator [Proteobacteria bacterium]|nr:MucR family transcriptional regulator [Pseudomonadota bacterium]MBU4296167.1 MucR family transcriptional regulator [Pseudomonadota bacterium]MCG2746763.1 MucR family transcriptional regulator [Desulfobulbaceae bacterium]